jgi:hypothetical protein
MLLPVPEELLKLSFWNCQQTLRCRVLYRFHVIKTFAFQFSQFQGRENKSRGAMFDELGRIFCGIALGL